MQQQKTKMPEVKGRVNIKAYRGETNELAWEDTVDNLVVALGESTILYSLDPNNVTNRTITQVAFGTNGTATTLGDTAITNQFIKAIGATTHPTATSTLIAFTLETTEGNGMTIQELGLVGHDNVLFSRLTRNGIVKTSDIRLVCTWTLSY